MRWKLIFLSLLVTLAPRGAVFADQPQSAPGAGQSKSASRQETRPAQSSPSPDASPDSQEPQAAAGDPDTELQMAVQQAANDNAALVRNLEAYLARYPESPRRVPIYRALAQSEMELRNRRAALDYAEKVIAIRPDDSQTMFLAATILEKMPDDASQLHAIDYDTRLIELVAKANPESRPQQMTLDDWQAGRKKFTVQLYVLRGRTERHLHQNEEAAKDFNAGFQLIPNADAALNLGEIAEEQKHSDEAIRQYAYAFVLASDDPEASALNQNAMRLRMGNLWRLSHDSNTGLGDVLLAAFDKNNEIAKADQPEAVVYNQGVTDPLQFTMRQVDGKASVKLADSHGKVIILNFWTSWCAYCRTMENLLTDARTKISGRDEVLTFAVNADEDGSLAAPFLEDHPVEGNLVFADGLDKAFHVESLPTILILDRSGKVVYRAQGYAPDGFADTVAAAITKALAVK